MGFFQSLFNPITSLLTPGGTNAARKQQEGQQVFGDIANGIGKDAGKTWADWLKFSRGFTPQMQAGITDAVNNLSSSGRFNSAVRGGNFARAQAMSQSTPLAYAGNPLLAQAYQGQQLNKANDYQNASIQRSQSPEAANQALAQLFALMTQGNQNAYQPFQQAAGISFGTPRVQVQPGLLDYAGGALGMMGGKGSVGMGRSQGVNHTMYDTPIGPQMPGGNDGTQDNGDTGVPTSNPYKWMSSTNWG